MIDLMIDLLRIAFSYHVKNLECPDYARIRIPPPYSRTICMILE